MKNNYLFRIWAIACCWMFSAGLSASVNETDKISENMDEALYMLLGTYTDGESKGIYVYRFDPLTGESRYVGMEEVANPSYLTTDISGHFVYAVTENGGNPSYANALSFNKETGALKLLNRQETRGGAPCNIALSPDGKMVVTANYVGGNISVSPVKADGTLLPASQVIPFKGKSVVAERQDTPHLHCVQFSPDGKYLFATDLGTDKIYRLETNTSGKGNLLREESLTAFKVKDGSGPRHFVMHPSGKYMYLINELSGTVIVFSYGNGNLNEVQAVVADDHGAQGSADITITSDGKYLYASNRLKGDGVAIFSVNPRDGKLTRVGYQPTGIHPRNMALSPNGKYLLVANRDSNSVEVYEIIQETGLLTNIHKDIRIDKPVCILFIP